MILSSTYLGNIEFYHQLTLYSQVQIDFEEKFLKQTYRNRAVILTANGTQNLSVPAIRPNGQLSKMSEVLISTLKTGEKIT